MGKTADESKENEAHDALSSLRELKDEQLEVLAQQLDVAAVQVVVVAIPAPVGTAQNPSLKSSRRSSITASNYRLSVRVRFCSGKLGMVEFLATSRRRNSV